MTNYGSGHGTATALASGCVRSNR